MTDLGNDIYRYGELPIKPGSEIDKALNVIANDSVNCRRSDEGFEAYKLLDPSSVAQMLALGVRIYFLRSGVTRPIELVNEQYGQWFGKPMSRR